MMSSLKAAAPHQAPLLCSFCGYPEPEGGTMVTAPGRVSICSECVTLAHEIGAERRGRANGEAARIAELIAANNREVERRRAAESRLRAIGALFKMPTAWWRHQRRGGDFMEIGRATLEAARPVGEGAEIVFYMDMAGGLWCREAGEFADGRFASIDAFGVDGRP